MSNPYQELFSSNSPGWMTLLTVCVELILADLGLKLIIVLAQYKTKHLA